MDLECLNPTFSSASQNLLSVYEMLMFRGCLIGRSKPDIFVLTRYKSVFLAHPPLHPAYTAPHTSDTTTSEAPYHPITITVIHRAPRQSVGKLSRLYLGQASTILRHSARRSIIAGAPFTRSSPLHQQQQQLPYVLQVSPYQRAGATVSSGALEGVGGPLQWRRTAVCA